MERVKIVEVGPRDGLQNETNKFSVADRVELIRKLMAAGAKWIEAGSFVSPKAVPQMADSEKVFEALAKEKSANFIFLVPNEKGLDRALQAGVHSIAVFTATSSSFTQKNIGMNVEESLSVFRKVLERAKKEKFWVRAHVSTVFGCPYEGPQNPQRAVDVSRELLEMGCDEIAICDTIGVAHPNQIRDVFERLKAQFKKLEPFAGHFHDTRGMALTNIKTALEVGVRIFDSSVGGLGGCPYAPGSSGNVATEGVAWLLSGLGFETGLSVEGVLEIDSWIQPKLGKPLKSPLFLSNPKRLSYVYS